MSGTLVENGFNDLFQDYFFSKKVLHYLFFNSSWRFAYGMVSWYFEYV